MTLVTALALLLTVDAQAQDDLPAKRFSVGLSGGVRPDMAQLGRTITQDGTIDLAQTTFASVFYGTDQALMSDRDNATLAENSRLTDSPFNLLRDHETGGAMTGIEFGGSVRYELDDVIAWPLFVNLGLYYTGRVAGGQQSRTLGDVTEQNEAIRQLILLNGLEPGDFADGTMGTSWGASWIEVPLSVGMKVAVTPHTFLYGSAGASLFSGGFSVGIDVDERYANVLSTHVDPATGAITSFSPGAVEDTIRFRTTAIGLNYALGGQVAVGRTFAVFLELNHSGATRTVLSQGLDADTQRLLTAATSQAIAAEDPRWFRNMAYPVVLQGAAARIGVRAYLF